MNEEVEEGGIRRAREKPHIEGVYGLADRSRGIVTLIALDLVIIKPTDTLR